MPRFVWTIFAIVVIWGAPSSTFGAAKKVIITIDGLKYRPAAVEIEVGDTVVWTNNDDRQHTVTADDASFDSGPIKTGKSYSRTFDKPGKISYGSDPSPRTKGVIVVKEPSKK